MAHDHHARHPAPRPPAPILKTLLEVLAAGDAWETVLGSPITDKAVAQAARPPHRCRLDLHHGRTLAASADPTERRRRAFDAFTAHAPHTPVDTWTIWSGPSTDYPTRAIRASVYTPSGLLADLADLAEELAHGTGTRQASPQQAQSSTSLTTTAVPVPPASPSSPVAGPGH
ncbi:hypothetical protein AB0D71_46845 [Streptomyces avermitilis]|uniref:hypothetical protein n=1 Tax=Streptomyces avermitilis TaxID=33903 RepID=UPI0033C680CB